ncbi:MAG: AbrB/MazE/SpoVT family DNA-binding domain-containing protein [Elusimicrobia bacterium]|nr:AbrB/MazE/SpoVT family DNA-binding domain-containing protein [Elusimicrobiota bacterium]
MGKLLRVSDRHQITIPPSVLRDAGLTEGSYVAIEARGGKIILEPRDLSGKEFSAEDWDKMDGLVAKQVRGKKYSEYPDPRRAKEHLK